MGNMRAEVSPKQNKKRRGTDQSLERTDKAEQEVGVPTHKAKNHKFIFKNTLYFVLPFPTFATAILGECFFSINLG